MISLSCFSLNKFSSNLYQCNLLNDNKLSSSEVVTDICGNNYNTVVIGAQTWFAENLRTCKYKNGDNIPNVPLSANWSSLTTGAYTILGNNNSYETLFGKLYNWQAVAGIWNTASITDINQRKSFAPDGWRVPGVADFDVLINNLPYGGGTTYAGVKLRETGNITWGSAGFGSVFYNGSNSTGFTARGAGVRTSNGFGGFRTNFYIWTYDQASSTTANAYRVVSNTASITSVTLLKVTGSSVRLIKI